MLLFDGLVQSYTTDYTSVKGYLSTRNEQQDCSPNQRDITKYWRTVRILGQRVRFLV
jgi:hypothetical protein